MNWLSSLRALPQKLGIDAMSATSASGAKETKDAGQGGFISLHETRNANWSSRNYLSMSREGFMRNPIAHRAIRMISETAANVPWILTENGIRLEDHPGRTFGHAG